MAVLFDLDGTLLDTVVDFHTAINYVLQKHNKEPIAVEYIRPYASSGSRVMTQQAFGLNSQDPQLPSLVDEFLNAYQCNNHKGTKPFPEIELVLTYLEQNNITWGIVTNKMTYLTTPLVQLLGYDKRAAAIVSGDTTAHAKPHPLPLLHACQIMQVEPSTCIYIGDAECDMLAGKAAGMRTIAACYGYINNIAATNNWPCDAIVHKVSELLPWLKKWLSL